MFRVPKLKTIDKSANSFSLSKNTTKNFIGFIIKTKNIPTVYSFLDSSSLNFVYTKSYDDTLLDNNSYNTFDSSNLDCIPNLNVTPKGITVSSKSDNRFLTLFLPDKETKEITDFIISIFNSLSNELTYNLIDNTKKLITESLQINLQYNYKNAPRLSVKFDTQNIVLNKIIKTIVNKQNYKDIVFSLFNTPYVLNTINCEVSKQESKNKQVYFKYNLDFLHKVEYYSNIDIYLSKINTLSSIGKTGTSSIPTGFDYKNITAFTAGNYESIGYYDIALTSLGLKEVKEDIDSNISTYFLKTSPPEISERTTLSSEISKVFEKTPVYPLYRQKLTFKKNSERASHIINSNEILSDISFTNSVNNITKINYPLSGLKSLKEVLNEKEQEEKADKVNNAFYFETKKASSSTIVENKEASSKPSYVFTLKSLDLCFDQSGDTKTTVVSKYESGSILTQTITTYGFVYRASDIYGITFGENPYDRFEPKVDTLNTPAAQFWKPISQENVAFNYGNHGYLVGIKTSGWRLTRYDSGQEEVETIIRMNELKYKAGSTGKTKLNDKEQAELQLLGWKLNLFSFISVPIKGFTKYKLHPIDGVFKDKDYIGEQFIIYYDPVNKKKVPIKDERYTPSYFASVSTTYKSSFAKTLNQTIDTYSSSNPRGGVVDFYNRPYLTTGEEFFEETRIKIIKNNAISYIASSSAGYPVEGSGTEDTPRYIEYYRKMSSQDGSFANCSGEESSSYKEGIPPEHTRKENNTILKYYSENLDKNKPSEKFNINYYYSEGVEQTKSTSSAVGNLKSNVEYSSSLIPVKNSSDIKDLLEFQLNEEKINSLGTISFEALYNPFIKEGDIVKINLKDGDDNIIDILEGIVLSISFNIISTVINSKVLFKNICNYTLSNGIPKSTILTLSYSKYLNDELEEEKSNDVIEILADPINLGGFGDLFSEVGFETRGNF